MGGQSAGSTLGNLMRAGSGMRETKKNAQAVERQRKANLALFNSLDYEPMYASETTPMMQRTQSPVARSYLESMLMGNNPSSISSTRPNAGVQKAQAQRSQNAMFGTPEARVAQQRALEQQPMYQVQTPTRKVAGTSESKDRQQYIAEHPDAAGIGVTRELENVWKEKFGGKGLHDDPFAYAAMREALGNGWSPERIVAELRGGGTLAKFQNTKNPRAR